MTTGSPPMCWTRVSRAYSETAMRPVIFSSDGRRTVADADIARDLTWEVWKVATIGPSAAHRASTAMLGVAGSWMCRTSHSPARSHRRTRAATTGPNDTRATDPLSGTGLA